MTARITQIIGTANGAARGVRIGMAKYAEIQTTGYNDDLVFLSFTERTPSEKPSIKTENVNSANAINWTKWGTIIAAIGIIVSIIIFILSS